MGNPKLGLKIALCGALLPVAVLCVFRWRYIAAFLSLCFAWVPLCAPFCLLQLFLCQRCRDIVLRLLPLGAACVGVLWSLWYLSQSSNWEVLGGLFVLVPSMLVLTGCSMGWLVWYFMERRKK